jgi:hypothetical protein
MSHRRRTHNWILHRSALLIALAALLLGGLATAAFAAQGANGANVQWRNEGFSSAKGWTTGEIGPYDEGSLVPFRLTVTNPSSTKSAVVGGFSLQVTAHAHGVAVFDGTTGWTGPLSPSSQDGVVGDMLRTTFPAGLTLAPGQSATFTFKGHLAVSSAGHPAAGMLNGNGVCGFSEVDAAGVGAFGMRVPVKVNAHVGTLGTPAVDIVASSDAPSSGVAAGTNVTFTYVIKNIGDVALYNAVVSDDQFGAVGSIAGPLAPGASQTLTAERTLTQTVAGTATVAASDSAGREANDAAPYTVAVFSSARIFGSVYMDTDGNGAWDAIDFGYPGFVVQLLDGSGNVIAETLTDPTGAYAFENITPGQSYTIQIVQQQDWFLTAPIGGTFSITPAPGQNAGPFDFGNYPQIVT